MAARKRAELFQSNPLCIRIHGARGFDQTGTKTPQPHQAVERSVEAPPALSHSGNPLSVDTQWRWAPEGHRVIVVSWLLYLEPRRAPATLSWSRFCEVAGAMPVSWDFGSRHNSTDDTQRVLAEFNGRLPLSTTFDTRARACRRPEHRGRRGHPSVHLWTDDDVLVNERWMPPLLGGFQEQNADWVMGRSRASWEAGVPDWFSIGTGWVFRPADYGDKPFVVTARITRRTA